MSTEITNHPNPSPEVPQETNRLPVVAMRGVVVFPGMTIHFDLVRETFLHALRAGMGKDRRVILVAQKDAIVEDPKPEDFYTVGVIADLRQVMRTPSGVTRVLAEGKTKAYASICPGTGFVNHIKCLCHFIKIFSWDSFAKILDHQFPSRCCQYEFGIVRGGFYCVVNKIVYQT